MSFVFATFDAALVSAVEAVLGAGTRLESQIEQVERIVPGSSAWQCVAQPVAIESADSNLGTFGVQATFQRHIALQSGADELAALGTLYAFYTSTPGVLLPDFWQGLAGVRRVLDRGNLTYSREGRVLSSSLEVILEPNP